MASNISSGNKTSRPHNPKQSNLQYSTESEKLLVFFKSLGYEAPKNLKPEHLDYIFKNEKSAALVKKLMQTLKPENVLTVDEVEKCEALKDEGLLMSGEDLERAVRHRAALDRKHLEEDHKEELQTEELNRLINLRQEEIFQIRKQKEMLSKIREKQKLRDDYKVAQSSQFQRELDNLDIAIQVCRKRVDDKAEKLKEVKAKVLSRFVSHDDDNMMDMESDGKLMGDWDWDSFLEKENNLTSQIEEFISAHVPSLIIESEGYNERCDEENRIQDAIGKYVDGFERLRHSLVYEEVRRIQLSCKLAKEQTSVRMMTSMKEKGAKSLKRGMDMSLVEKELENSIKDGESALEKAIAETLQTVRENTLQQVDTRFYALVESRNRAKRRLETFIAQIYQILEAQKVRIDIVRHLMSKEVGHFADLKSRLMILEHRLAAVNLNDRRSDPIDILTSEGRVVSRIFQQLGYPVDTLYSVSKSFNIIFEVYHNASRNISFRDAVENVEQEEQIKKMSRQINQMKTKFQKLSAIRCNEIQTLESQTEEKLILLETMQEEHSILESIGKQKELLEAMKSALNQSEVYAEN